MDLDGILSGWVKAWYSLLKSVKINLQNVDNVNKQGKKMEIKKQLLHMGQLFTEIMFYISGRQSIHL